MSTQRLVEAQNLLDSLNMGRISKSCYDIAWVLRSGVITGDDRTILINKLRSSQYNDGSWGAQLTYIHDRVINTLAVVIALIEQGGFDFEVKRGIEYLNLFIPKLRTEAIETIGFELTFLSLLKTASRSKIDLPYDSDVVLYYAQLAEQKRGLLKAVPLSRPTTITHSLEAFDDDEIDLSTVALFDNGSLGNSPAATAFYVKKVGSTNAVKSINYLTQFKSMDWDIPSIYPFEIFEKAWVLYHFLHVGILDKLDYKKHTDYLWHHWQKFGGASISNDFPIIDSDDTAVTFIVLKETGYPVDATVFEQFEQEKWFRCFDLERNPSISANIHVLEAMILSDEYSGRDRAISKILAFLDKALSATWVDKWQVSPYYCAAHLLIAIRTLNHSLLQKTLGFIYSSQNVDGGWGIRSSSFEETKYVLLALGTLDREYQKDDSLARARAFLQTGAFTPNVELWVDKGLYAPLSVIESLKSVL